MVTIHQEEDKEWKKKIADHYAEFERKVKNCKKDTKKKLLKTESDAQDEWKKSSREQRLENNRNWWFKTNEDKDFMDDL